MERVMLEARRCTATNREGERCARYAIKGGTVCPSHGGRAPAVKAAAARRLAEAEAMVSLTEVEVQAVDNPLEELANVAAEIRAMQKHVGNLVGELTSLTEPTMFGEQVHVMVRLYERMLDRTAKVLADWARLGFDERMATLNERQADLVERFVVHVVDRLDPTDEQRDRLPDAVVEMLPILTGQLVPPADLTVPVMRHSRELRAVPAPGDGA